MGYLNFSVKVLKYCFLLLFSSRIRLRNLLRLQLTSPALPSPPHPRLPWGVYLATNFIILLSPILLICVYHLSPFAISFKFVNFSWVKLLKSPYGKYLEEYCLLGYNTV
jgi:hypothetical protein